MPFLPSPGQLGHKFPPTPREHPGIRAEAFEEEREAATAVRRFLDQEFALAAVVRKSLGVRETDEKPAQPVGEITADEQQVLGAQLREEPFQALGGVDLQGVEEL